MGAFWKGEKTNLGKSVFDQKSEAIFEISDPENAYFDSLPRAFPFENHKLGYVLASVGEGREKELSLKKKLLPN